VYIMVCNKKVPVILKSDEDMEGAYGMFQTGDECIWIRSNLELKHRRKTVSHEAFHAVLHFTGHSYLFDKLNYFDVEESLVRAFEFGLGDHLKFPPLVEKWVSGKEIKQ